MDKRTKDFKISFLADLYGALITERQLALVRDYYDNDMSLSELSEKYGIARQSAKDGINAAEKSLTGYEEKLGLMEKLKKIDSLTDILLSVDKKDNAEYIGIVQKIKSCIYQ